MGQALPSGAQCARWVREQPAAENKSGNRPANQATGHRVSGVLFDGGDPRAEALITARIDGQFTGTTDEILRWVACKWGIDEDIVRAQAAVESWWRQSELGDWGTDAASCAPGRGFGRDGRTDQCPESFGIMQVRYPYYSSAWPGLAESTAMNADVAYAIWRGCFEGYETWLNDVEQGRPYRAGDLWGCVGRWFSGRWHMPDGDEYVAEVRDSLTKRVWQTADFAEI